jgi:hypothetical protein
VDKIKRLHNQIEAAKLLISYDPSKKLQMGELMSEILKDTEDGLIEVCLYLRSYSYCFYNKTCNNHYIFVQVKIKAANVLMMCDETKKQKVSVFLASILKV